MCRRSRPRDEDEGPAELLRATMPRSATHRRRNDRQRVLEKESLEVCIPCVRVTLTPFPPHSRLHHNHWTSAPRPVPPRRPREVRSCPILREAVRIRRVPRITRGPTMAFCRTPQGRLFSCAETNYPKYATRSCSLRWTAGREEAYRGVTFTMGSLINEERGPRGSVTKLGRTECQPHLRIPAIRRLFGGRFTLPHAHHHSAALCAQ